MSRRACLTIALVVSTLASLGPGGCGGEGMMKAAKKESGAAEPAVAPPPAGGMAPNPAAPNATQDRPRIIYTAHLELVVKELDAARAEVDTLLAAQKGYVVKSEVRNDSGTRRTATYSLRVPVDNFTALVNALTGLGVPERNAVDSLDVSEEYVDVQARVKNLKEQEAKLNELLKERRKEEKLEDVMRIGDRIGAVRQDVERAEGRLKFLATQTTNSTVNLTLKEIKDYKPPTAPTFRDRVAGTFGGSWESFVGFLEGVVLVAVALMPWLPLLLPLGLLGLWGVRKAWRFAGSQPERPARPRRTPRAEPVSDVPAESHAEEARPRLSPEDLKSE